MQCQLPLDRPLRAPYLPESLESMSEYSSSAHRRILGINFLLGDAESMVSSVMSGGLVVVPSGPGLSDLPVDRAYREAVLNSDFAITDSALMVYLWNILQRDRVPRVSGLYYLETLLARQELRKAGATFWVMPGPESSQRNLCWLRSQGIHVSDSNVYIAPRYNRPIEDLGLARRLNEIRPSHVFIAVGGGVQEPLGFYLKRALDFRPSIHCIGAAIAFLSGDQSAIPIWADRSGLGWLVRCISRPGIYVPRYWAARRLAGLLIRYREQLPPLRG